MSYSESKFFILKVLTCGVVAGTLLSLGAGPASAKIMTDRCGAGIILIGVRGTNEPAGMGKTVAVVQSLFNGDAQIPTWSQAITYPAVVVSSTANYFSSVQTGAANLRSTLETIASQCPYASINLAGYSQGAHVVGDVLAGSDGKPLSSRARSHITSAILFGDPTFRAGQTWNAPGSGSSSGIFPRTSGAFSSWTRLAYPSPSATKPVQMPIVRSYCYTGDRFCQKGIGSNADAIHSSYSSTATYAAYEFMRTWNYSAVRSTVPVVTG